MRPPIQAPMAENTIVDDDHPLPNASLFQPATYKVVPNGQVLGYADVPTHPKQGEYIDFYAQMDLLILVSLCPCFDDLATWQEVALAPMKVEVFETGTTPPEFPRFHHWRRSFPGDMVVPDN